MFVLLSRQIRSTLEGVSTLPLAEILQLVDEFVRECSSSAERDGLVQFEKELQTIHRQVVDHSSISQTEVFLAVLYRLRVVLSSTSIISTWFDLVLCPALREAKLPMTATSHAKGLIISALSSANPDHLEKVREFRSRLLDFYLLDTYNEGSGDDVLEWAELDQAQRVKKTCWKDNLEGLLLKFGAERPQDLMVELHNYFSVPSSRLQLLIFLNIFTSELSFSSVAAVLAKHPLMSGLLNTLLLDNSSTVCTIGLTLLVKLLPIFAVEAYEQLKSMLPRFLAVLARIVCWKEPPLSLPLQKGEMAQEKEIDVRVERTSNIRPDLRWRRLERTFSVAPTLAPSPRQLFNILYYLFPCNVVKFLRNPVSHLIRSGDECPYVVGWEAMLDEEEIRSKSEALLRTHVCHTSVIWHDETDELCNKAIWAQYDVARIITEAEMLGVINAALAMRQKASELTSTSSPPSPVQDELEGSQSDPMAGDMPNVHDKNRISEPNTAPASDTSTTSLNNSEITSRPAIDHQLTGQSYLSLQDMITTSAALKSDVNFEITCPGSSWPSALFPNFISSSSVSPPGDSKPSSTTDGTPTRVSHALSSLQREVLLLRNELNFELWLSRENIKHIGRLYQERILSKNAEVERQLLSNKLHNYKTQVAGLERELKDHKEHASSAKSKYSDWNSELVQKLRVLREEKKSWIIEAATLRTAEKEAKALFVAQGQLLAEASNKVFELKTQIKATQPKLDRVVDYERQIDQHIKMQRLWDDDFKKFNDRAEKIELMKSQYKQMELRLESHLQTQAEQEKNLQAQRQEILALKAQLASEKAKAESSKQIAPAELTAFAAENLEMKNTNSKLREENRALKAKEGELQDMVQVLKGQLSGTKGVISDEFESILRRKHTGESIH